MEAKISVIVPVYNVEKYLQRCVESLVAQSYSNLEIILINDGSTDTSSDICNQMEEIYSRVKVINKINGGLSDARNEGLKHATGEYITFLDSDDYIHPRTYELIIENMNLYQADIGEAAYKKIWSDVNHIYTNNYEVVDVNNIEAIRLNCAWKMFVSTVWNKVYKREILEGLNFEVGKINEDEFFTYKALYKAKRLVHITYPLYYYQQRKDSIMGEGLNIKRIDGIEAQIEKIKFFAENEKELLDVVAQRALVICFNMFEEAALYGRDKEFIIRDKLVDKVLEISNLCNIDKILNKKRRILIRFMKSDKQSFIKMYSSYLTIKRNTK